MPKWAGGLAEWTDGDTAYLSVAFTWCVWVDGFLGHAGKWRWGRYASEAVARSVMDKLALRRLPNGKPLWTGIELRYRNTTTAVASPSGVASSLTTTKK